MTLQWVQREKGLVELLAAWLGETADAVDVADAPTNGQARAAS